jgi:hypothetical protein
MERCVIIRHNVLHRRVRRQRNARPVQSEQFHKILGAGTRADLGVMKPLLVPLRIIVPSSTAEIVRTIRLPDRALRQMHKRHGPMGRVR